MVKLRSSCCSTELGPPRRETRFEERPTEREKHRLRIGPALRRAPMRFVEQPNGVLVRQRFESFADQGDTYVDLLEACQTPKQLFERSCVLHDLGVPLVSLMRVGLNASLTQCVAGLASYQPWL